MALPKFLFKSNLFHLHLKVTLGFRVQGSHLVREVLGAAEVEDSQVMKRTPWGADQHRGGEARLLK